MRAVLLAVAAVLAAAAPAQAAFTLANPSSAPDDKAAGAHSDVRIHVEPQGGDIRDLVLHLPPGLIGDPQATPLCSVAAFEGPGCPAATQVGRAANQIQLGLVSQRAEGEIFNLQPRGDEPARLGIRITPPTGGEPIRLESPVTSRPSDSGLDSTLKDIPNQFQGLDITITALDVQLFGRVAGGRAFMTNPTSCAAAETGFEARSYAGETATAKASFTPERCEALPFSPGFEAVLGAPGQTGLRANPPLTTAVTQQAGEANVRRVAVTLPKDLAVPLDRLGRACAGETFAAGGCAPTSVVGQATAVTPLLRAPLAGPVSFITGAGNLPDLVLQLRGPLALTLRGTNAFTPGGQQTTFDGLPDVPLSRFELAFAGGQAGLLALTRDACDGRPPQLQATFTSQAGVERSVTVPAKVVGCVPTATVTRRRALLRVRAVAGAERLKQVVVTLPRGARAARRARPRVSGSGARSARAVRRGRRVTVTVPGAGARTVALQLRLRRRVGRRAKVGVATTDATGARTTLTASPAS